MNEKIKYPFLPEGREIKYVSENNNFMMEARNVAKTGSTDSLQPTGAVVVYNGKIIGRGANHSLVGKVKFLNNLHKKGLCTRKILNIPSGKGYWTCAGCVTNKNHAEATAVRNALKKTKNIEGADLFLWGHWWCCEHCWKSMINAGIRDVYLLDSSWEKFSRESNENILGKQFVDANE
jgi:deoxycytidylate deaminase